MNSELAYISQTHEMDSNRSLKVNGNLWSEDFRREVDSGSEQRSTNGFTLDIKQAKAMALLNLGSSPFLSQNSMQMNPIVNRSSEFRPEHHYVQPNQAKPQSGSITRPQSLPPGNVQRQLPPNHLYHPSLQQFLPNGESTIHGNGSSSSFVKKNSNNEIEAATSAISSVSRRSTVHEEASPWSSCTPPRNLNDIPSCFTLPLSNESGSGDSATPGSSGSHGLRLPPSLITRHIPLPIQNLPSLPPISPQLTNGNVGAGSTPVRPSLRKLPTLPITSVVPRNDEGNRDGSEGEMEMDSDMDDEDSLSDEDENEIANAAEEGNVNASKDASTNQSKSTHVPAGNSISSDTSKYDADSFPVSDLLKKDINFTQKGKSVPSPNTPLGSQSAYGENGDHFTIPTIVTTDASTRITDGNGFKVQGLSPTMANIRTQQPPSTASSTVAQSHSRVTKDPSSELRPACNRQASRSMANLIQPNAGMIKEVESQPGGDPVGTLTAPSPTPLHRRISLPDMSSPGIRDSMPFSLNRFLGDPPPPREEEGAECLPAYELTIPLLAASFPRKVEFVSPGIQASDRRWKRVWCVLEGTSFKLYEGERGWEKVGGWFGRYNGKDKKVQKKTKGEPKIVIAGLTPEETMQQQQQKFEYGEQQLPMVSHGTDRASVSSRLSGYASSSRTSMSRRSSLSRHEPEPSTNAHLAPSHINSTPSHHNHLPPPNSLLTAKNDGSHGGFHRRSRSDGSQAMLSASNSASHSTHSLMISNEQQARQHQRSASHPHCGSQRDLDNLYQHSSQPTMLPCECPPPMPSMKNIQDISYITERPLIRQYTLQNAESGVAIDYHKRPNVIRVRLEGEQFLLQAVNVEQVVEWIEGFQSAADISLDLDQRIMPRGPIFPRRRRRHRIRLA